MWVRVGSPPPTKASVHHHMSTCECVHTLLDGVGVFPMSMLDVMHVSVWWCAKAHEHEVYPSCAPLDM